MFTKALLYLRRTPKRHVNAMHDALIRHHHMPISPHLFFILTLLPGRLAPPDDLPFILLTEKPRPSALDCASLLFAWRFLPPKPYFWSFFARLLSPLPSLPRRSVGVASVSRATSKRSSSLVLPMSAPCRSVAWLACETQYSIHHERTPLQQIDLLQRVLLLLCTLLHLGNLHLFAELLEIPLLPCLS